MTTPRASEPRYVVQHDEIRRQWQIIDRETGRGRSVAVVGELDDHYPTSRRVVERYCRQLNLQEHGDGDA